MNPPAAHGHDVVKGSPGDARGNDARLQPAGSFLPGDLASGYYVDLRGVAGSYGPPAHAQAWLELLAARRERVMPVTLLQLGLGAWQRSLDLDDPDAGGWAQVARAVAEWAVLDMDGHGRFAHHRPMPHTYDIDPPWHSAMAQGLATSLLLRHGMPDQAARAAASLLDERHGLVSQTPDGPVLEEYPAEPRPHVLNGWMWALWGLHDLAVAPDVPDVSQEPAHAAFDRGVRSLVTQLPLYESRGGWSTYDRYPHPVRNVASPFYQRLHVVMLRSMFRLAPPDCDRMVLADTADRWEAALGDRSTRTFALLRKVAFRLVKPRRNAA